MLPTVTLEVMMDEPASLEAWLYERHHRRELDRSLAARAPLRRRELLVPARDGTLLAATAFSPDAERPPRDRVVVVASATGVKRRYYAAFAEHLASRGFTTVTFDYRGIGASKESGRRAFMHEWGEQDLAGVVDWAASALGDGRVSLVGHSVGGQLVGLLPAPSLVRALVTVAAQSGDYRLWPLPSRLAMALLWYGVVPGVTRAVGYLPGSLGVGEDLPKGVALEWARWCRTPGYLVGGDGAPRRDGFAQLRAPVLAFGFDDDVYAPPAAVTALLSLYTNASIERRQIPRGERRIGHFGFFRRRGRELWREAAEFLERASCSLARTR
jgi:predicted alpha/beta hydrolase